MSVVVEAFTGAAMNTMKKCLSFDDANSAATQVAVVLP